MFSQSFFFLLKLILTTELIHYSNCHEKIKNYQSAINYYPVELFNTTINNNYTVYEKSKIYKILNHTKVCQTFSWFDENNLSAVLDKNDTDDIVNLNNTMNMINNMFINVFKQKLSNESIMESNNGDVETIIEAASEINDFVYDKDNNTNFDLTVLLTIMRNFSEQLKVLYDFQY